MAVSNKQAFAPPSSACVLAPLARICMHACMQYRPFGFNLQVRKP